MVGFLSGSKVKTVHERGIEKTRKGDMQGALKDFTEVIKLDPKHADAYFRRGYLLMRNGDLSAAAQDFVNALKLDANHPNASMMKEMLKRATEMRTRTTPPAAPPTPVTPVTQPEQTTASPASDQGFVDSQISAVPSAAAAAAAAAEVATDSEIDVTPNMFIARGIELYENDQVEEAIDTFIEALKIDPDNAEAYINLGAIYHHYDEDELAHEYFKTALNLAPNHPDAARMRELLRVTEENTRTKRGLMADDNADKAGDLPVVPD